MSEQSTFHKKNLEIIDPEAKRGVLEELNLPPKVITFFRANAKQLQIAGICVLILIVAWIAFDYYIEKKRNQAASMLSLALQEEDLGSRTAALQKVNSDFAGTTAALWSQLELGHLDRQAGRLDEALEKYGAVLDKTAGENPLLPLVRYGMALTLEQKGDYAAALSHYLYLAGIPGFSRQGHLSAGKMYEKTGENGKAIEAYEKYLAEPGNRSGSADHDFVTDRVAGLKALGNEQDSAEK